VRPCVAIPVSPGNDTRQMLRNRHERQQRHGHVPSHREADAL